MGDFLGVSEHLQDFAAYIRNEIDFGFALEPDHDMLAEQNKEAHLQELHERRRIHSRSFAHDTADFY